MKKGGQAPSAKKLRTIPVVCLLISCLFGVVFVTSEQVSATDITRYDSAEFNYDNWGFRLPNVNTYAREYVINQAGTLILPPVKGMIVGGVIGFALGGLVGAAVGLGIGGTIGTAVSVAQNMLTFVKSVTDWGSLRSNIDLDSLRSTKDWGSLRSNINPDLLKMDINPDLLKMDINPDLLKMDINPDLLKMDFNQELLKIRMNIPTAINPYAGITSSYDTSNMPKLRTDHIPKLNIPDTIPSFNPR